MFLESQTAKTMHLSDKNASRAPEGCHPCNLSIRATWGPFSYRRRAVWHPHLISQAAGAADFQGRRGYPNVRLFVAAGVARFKAAGALRIFKAAGVTQMYGFSWPPGLPENRRSYKQRAAWDLHLTSQAASGRGQRPTSQPARQPACSNDFRMALASAGTE